MIIQQIIRGVKRLLLGSTYRFAIRKGSTSLKGQSFTEIYREMTEYPLKLISITFITEDAVPGEYRIMCDGEQIFPFVGANNIESHVTRNFLLPINVASGSFLQVEVKSGIANKNVIILDEFAVIEVI